MKTYSTPQPYSLHSASVPTLSGRDLLYRLEDDYAEYRESVNLRLCKDDPNVHAEFKAKIAKAKGSEQ